MNNLSGKRFIPFRCLIITSFFVCARATTGNLDNGRRTVSSFKSNVNLKNSWIFLRNQIESENIIALTWLTRNLKIANPNLGSGENSDGHLNVKKSPEAPSNRVPGSAQKGRNYDLIDNQLYKLVSRQREYSGAAKGGKPRSITVNYNQEQRPVAALDGRHRTRGTNRAITSENKIVSVKEIGDLHLHAIGLIALGVYDVAGKGITYQGNAAPSTLSVNKSAKPGGDGDWKPAGIHDGVYTHSNTDVGAALSISGNNKSCNNKRVLCKELNLRFVINIVATRDKNKESYVKRYPVYDHATSGNTWRGNLSVSHKAITKTSHKGASSAAVHNLRDDLSAKITEKAIQRDENIFSATTTIDILSTPSTIQQHITIKHVTTSDVTNTRKKLSSFDEKIQLSRTKKEATLSEDDKKLHSVDKNIQLSRNTREVTLPVGDNHSPGSLSGYDIYVRLSELISTAMNLSDVDSPADVGRVPSLVERMCKEVFEDQPMKDDGHVYCNISWDEYSCWPRTLAGYVAVIPCPGYLPGIDHTNNATKFCHENGTWADKAIYDMCVGEDDPVIEDSHKKIIRAIYVVGFILSTLTLAVALFIFLYFRSLRCLRNSIHCHLIVAFILKNMIWIVMRDSLIAIQSSPHQWLCKLLVTLFNYLTATNFFWMYVEGLYLHIIIVWTYSADKIKLRYLLIIGWGLPFIFIIIWMIIKLEYENENCWLPDTQMGKGTLYDYIFIGPILFVLFANIIFLSTIIWVLITKLRASHSLETRQYRKAVKATIILFPLLGITYVLFIAPPSDDPGLQTVFDYINAVLQSFQGVCVAIFYCFLNGEVKGTLKKKISRYNDARSLSTRYTKASMGWTPGSASRDFGNSVVGESSETVRDNTRANGILAQSRTENIPLTNHADAETTLDS